MTNSLMQAAAKAGLIVDLLVDSSVRYFNLPTQDGSILIRPENVGRLIELAKGLKCADNILLLDTSRSELRRFESREIQVLSWKRSAFPSFSSRNCCTLGDWHREFQERLSKSGAVVASDSNANCLGNGTKADTCLREDSQMQSSVVSGTDELAGVVQGLLFDGARDQGQPVLTFSHQSKEYTIPLGNVVLFARRAREANFGMLLTSLAAPPDEVQRFRSKQIHSLKWETGSPATVEKRTSFAEWLQTLPKK